MRFWTFISVAVTAGTLLPDAAGGEFFPIPTGAAHFSTSAPYATASELSRRMGAAAGPAGYDVGREGFRVIAPGAPGTNSGWGLFVWISPGHDAYIPKDWEPVFAQHQLVFVAPYQSGNNRDVMERFRLALDAVCNLSREYGIDRKRIYVGGFSGGGRIASMLAMAYADVFTGAFCVCGVNFYQDVSFVAEDPGFAGIPGGGLTGPGQVRPSPTLRFAASFNPPQPMRELAKRNLRLYLLTGSMDQNRMNTKALYEQGFKRAGYRHVEYREISGFAHAIPNATELQKALGFLSPRA